MALISTLLKSEFEKFWDQESPSFEGFPENEVDAAVKWADAINQYASAVIPVSTTSELAKTSLLTLLSTISNVSQNGIAVLPSAFASYAAQLALGMQPAFTGTPPAIPINFSSLYALGLSGASNSECLDEFVSLVHAWFKTGIAVNNSTLATINWN